MKKVRLLFVISGIDYALGFDWLEKYLDKKRYQVSFIFLNTIEPELFRRFKSRGVEVYFLKSGSKKKYPLLFLKLIYLFAKRKPDIIHCHLYEANVLGLSAAWICGVSKRIYTRHHSTYHFDYHPRMVKVDKFINSMSTQIIAISRNVMSVLVEREGVDPKKVFIVNHGFELDKFISANREAVDVLGERYNPSHRFPVIGVISRFTEWKGVQYIIPAFKKLLQDYPNALMILANAKGDMQVEINEMLNQLPENSYRTIEFERDIASLYRLFDIFVHVPVDKFAEAFGQTYVESLASGVPSVVTLSGIACEFVPG
ncbi:MAG: glycosyltransferase [Bacteroidetes bacterium]|nr:glycosyltransferase [Bacteroidota bacterium]